MEKLQIYHLSNCTQHYQQYRFNVVSTVNKFLHPWDSTTDLSNDWLTIVQSRPIEDTISGKLVNQILKRVNLYTPWKRHERFNYGIHYSAILHIYKKKKNKKRIVNTLYGITWREEGRDKKKRLRRRWKTVPNALFLR